MNLLDETKKAINESGHFTDDIIFIGSEESGHECSWDEFIQLADHEYDGGFGEQEVAQDLIIVFSDGQKMWRGESDGSEWWEYSSPFVKPKKARTIKNLFAKVGWESLKELNARAK